MESANCWIFQIQSHLTEKVCAISKLNTSVSIYMYLPPSPQFSLVTCSFLTYEPHILLSRYIS